MKLDANESCFALPENIRDAAAQAVRAVDLHRYPDPDAAGVCSLAEAFWGAPPGSAVAGNGSDELISVALNALLPRGGKLLVCDPDFSMYRFYAAQNELECVGLERFSGVPDIGEIIKKGRTADAVILSNPCNPTGQGVPGEDILRLPDALGCPVLIDEAYMDFWEDGRHSVLPYITRYNNLLIFKTCSKNLAAAGIRLGFAFAGTKLIKTLRENKSPYNVNAVTQAIGAVLLKSPEWLRENTLRLVREKDSLYVSLREWARDIPDCTITNTVVNFVLITLPDAEGWHKYLLEQGISVRSLPGILRITAGSEKERDALLAALKGRKTV